MDQKIQAIISKNNKKNKFKKSLSEDLIIPNNNKININNLKIINSDEKKIIPKIKLPIIDSNRKNKNNILLINNILNSQTINTFKVHTYGFNSKKPLENKKFKNKFLIKKNKSSLNIYNICLKKEYQKMHNIRYYNLNNIKNKEKILNDIHTNYLHNYNKNINHINLQNKPKNIKEYNILSPFESNNRFNNDKLNNLCKDQLNSISIKEEKSKLKKIIKKYIFHNVFFKWKNNYYSFDEKIKIINDYLKYLKLSIKHDITSLSNFFSKNKILLNIFNGKNNITNKFNRNKSAILFQKYSSFYKMINNINKNKSEINIKDLITSNSFEFKKTKNNIFNTFFDQPNTNNKTNNYNGVEKIEEVEENESLIYNNDENYNINSEENNFNKLIKPKRNPMSLNDIYDNNCLNEKNKFKFEKNKYFKTFQKNFFDNINKENNIGISMENFNFKDNNQIYNDYENNNINYSLNINGINFSTNINKNKKYKTFYNIINKSHNQKLINNNIINVILDEEINNNCINNKKNIIFKIKNKSNIFPKIQKNNNEISNVKKIVNKKEIKKIFIDKKEIINNIKLKRKSMPNFSIKNKSSIMNISNQKEKEKNNISGIEKNIYNLNLFNSDNEIELYGGHDIFSKEENEENNNKQSVNKKKIIKNKIINRNDIVNSNNNIKKMKKRRSVDNIYIKEDNSLSDIIIDDNLNIKLINQNKNKKRFSLDYNLQKININFDNLQSKSHNINKNNNKAKGKKKGKKKKNIKNNKIKNKDDINNNNNKENKKEQKNNEIKEESKNKALNKINNNKKEKIPTDNYAIINKQNQKMYQFNKELDFLKQIPKKSIKDIKKEEEIQKRHKNEAYNILMKSKINNLVKRKDKKSLFFQNKKMIKRLEIKNKNENQIKSPPNSLKRAITQSLNSEKYISNLLKKQLIYDNSYLFPKKQKPKIYKNINDVIALIPEDEKENIVIHEIKDKSNNNESKINNTNNNNNNLSIISINKGEEELSKDNDESISSFRLTKSSKFTKRKKNSRFTIKKGVMSRFIQGVEDKNEMKKESEKEKKERLLMEKLYNFFGKIQKMKNSTDNEVDEFINEEMEKKGINERRQRFLRLNSFIDDINYLRRYEKIFKSKIKFLSPLCFSSPSMFKK